MMLITDKDGGVYNALRKSTRRSHMDNKVGSFICYKNFVLVKFNAKSYIFWRPLDQFVHPSVSYDSTLAEGVSLLGELVYIRILYNFLHIFGREDYGAA